MRAQKKIERLESQISEISEKSMSESLTAPAD